jgi:hypothetical protein
MAKIKVPRWGWALTGSGHFFKECLAMIGGLDDVVVVRHVDGPCKLDEPVVEFPVPLIYLDEKRSFGGSLDDAKRIVSEFVTHYNERRLHSAIGYVTPLAKLEGREKQIFAERDRKLEAARELRRVARQATAQTISGQLLQN